MHINPIGLIGQQGLRCHVISMSGKSPTKLEATSPKITYTVLTGKLNLKWKNKQNQNWMRKLQNINCSKDNYFKRSKNSWWVCVLLLLYILNFLMIKMLQYKMYPAGELRCPTTALVISSVSSLSFLFLFLPCPSLSSLLLSLLLFSPFLWETTQNDPQGLKRR